MQHSVWVAEAISSNLEVANSKLFDVIPAEVLPKQFSFRRIWQGKGSQTAANKVLDLLLFSSGALLDRNFKESIIYFIILQPVFHSLPLMHLFMRDL